MANYTDNMNNSESKSYTDMNNAKSSAKNTTSKNSAKSKSSRAARTQRAGPRTATTKSDYETIGSPGSAP